MSEDSGAASSSALQFNSVNFSKRRGSYFLAAEGGQLFVALRKPKGGVDPRTGEVGPATIMRFPGKAVGLVSPVVLDLDGNGIVLKGRKESDARFDMDGDGVLDDTGWVGKKDGILVVDRNSNGRVDSVSELSFLADAPSARSDLEALATYDSNGDDRLDSKDSRFAELKLWVDRNGNGISEEGELKSLADHNISSIDLAARAVNSTAKVGSNMLIATSTFTRTDGSVGTVGDVALAFRPSVRAAGQTAAPPAFDSDLGVEATDRPVTSFQSLSDPSPPAGGRLGADLERLVAALRQWPAGGTEGSAGGAQAPRDSSSGNADYAVRIETANARLTQAMSAFSKPAAMMETTRPHLDEVRDRGDWLSVASLASDRMPVVK